MAATAPGQTGPSPDLPPQSPKGAPRWAAVAEDSPTPGGLLNVRQFGAKGDGVTDDTAALQAAWDTAKASGARVFLPEGQYRIRLTGDATRGYGPALHLSANAASKEKQPILEGATRAVTLTIAFPTDAPRTQEVIRIDKGALTDNPRGMQLRNIRLVNTRAAPPGSSWKEPYDFRGTGIKILNGWTGELLSNFQISGFYIGLYYENGYHTGISHGEIRDCNFGLYLRGTPNANSFRSIVLHYIRSVATNTEGWDAAIFPGGRIGACVYAGGGTISGAYFESVNTEMCSVAGYFFHSNPLSFTIVSMRSESCYAPVWVYGPKSPYYSAACTFISPSIDCDSLIAPAFYLHRARGYTIITPNFYQRNNKAGSQVAIEMTASSQGNYILNPQDDGSGTTGTLADDVVDAGKGNEVKWLGR